MGATDSSAAARSPFATRATVGLLHLALLASTSLAADPPLTSRTWVSVKGLFGQDGVLVADEIMRLDNASLSVKGVVDRFSRETGELHVGPMRFTVDARTRIQAGDGTDLSFDRLDDGLRVKLSLASRQSGPLRVRRVRTLAESTSRRVRLEGPVETVPTETGTALFFTVLGQSVRTDATTTWEGVEPPWTRVDDDDRRPGRGIRMGRFGYLSGEQRFDYIAERNFDLADQLETNLDTRRLRGRLEWVFPSTERVSGMIQLGYKSESAVDDDAADFRSASDVFLRRAYVNVHGILGKFGSIQAGRVPYNDDRDWLYNRNIDALRLLFDHPRFHLEASLGRELIDPTPRQRDVLNKHLLIGKSFARRHVVEAYVLDRQDDYRRASGFRRDFSPRLFGIRAAGETERNFSYWLEAALARGSVEQTPLDGKAFDVGVTWVAPWQWEPAVTVGYAYGSGDDDPFDGKDHTFRQSGLHLNNGRWNGVTNFRYYGELLRPELANLHIQTYGIGLKPRGRTSIDLIYHVYHLDEQASEFVDADIDLRRLNLQDRAVGREWDLVVGFEELRHLELELDLGYFIPGAAFLGPTDSAYSARLKVKFVF